MPLTKSGAMVKRSMQAQYGFDKGERVFYASINKGTPGSRTWHGKRAPIQRVLTKGR